jgi:LmbE family N-acetylglucosaminyl deacetylase
MNPYQAWVASLSKLITDGKSLPLGTIPRHETPCPPTEAPLALIFSPHPDDECIIGGLALRWLRESGLRVVNVAVTQGSNKERQQARWLELKDACDWLGFGLEATAPNGLEKIAPKTRTADPNHWESAVQIIAHSLRYNRPRVVFFPHANDWNGTHVGTHQLLVDALRKQAANFECLVVETEFWGQMDTPNLMVEIGETDLADMLTALSFHVGEVQRNPYHLRLPAYMLDNVRRGAELVGGQGGSAPSFQFATLYRLRRWRNSHLESFYAEGRQISVSTNPKVIFDWAVQATPA